MGKMILSKTISVGISSRNLKHYKQKGYIVNVGEIITVDVTDLPNKSTVKIKVKCDVCEKEKYLIYQKYTKNISKYNYYSCSQKCSSEKCKNTFLKNYGVTSPLKNDKIKQKSKDVCKKKYNKKFYVQTDEFKEKFKETSLQKYGVLYPMKSEIVKNILKNSLFKKYGVENAMFVDEIKEKVKQSKISNNIISPDVYITTLSFRWI